MRPGSQTAPAWVASLARISNTFGRFLCQRSLALRRHASCALPGQATLKGNPPSPSSCRVTRVCFLHSPGRATESSVKVDGSLQQFAHSPPNETPAELSRLDGLYRLRNCGVVRYIIDVRGDVHDRKLFSTVLSRPWVVA